MNAAPLDPTLVFTLMGVAPYVRDGTQQTTREGEPIHVVSVVLPPRGDERMDTAEVRLPVGGLPKDLAPLCQVRFDKLIARPWGINGKTGLTLSASAVHVVAMTAPKPVAP